MQKQHLKISISIMALQVFLLAVLVNNLVMTRWGYYRHFSSELLEVLLGLVIFLLCLASIFAVQQFYKTSREAQRYETEKLMFKHIEKQNQLYRQHKHDLKNQLMVISMLVEKGEPEKINRYIASYTASIDESIFHVDTGIKELDALLYNKFSEARENNILVEFNCNTGIKCHSRYLVDLVSLMSNALDNAIKACNSLEDEENRKIKLVLESDPVDYTICLSNTASQSSIKVLFNRDKQEIRRDPERGQGLSIIRRIVNRFGGKAEWTSREGLVDLTLELPRHRLEGWE